MSDAFVMGVVPKRDASIGEQAIDLARLIDEVRRQQPRQPQQGAVNVSLSKNGEAVLSFPDARGASGFADALLTQLMKTRPDGRTGTALSLSIHMGPKEDLQLPVIAHQLADEVARSNEIVIGQGVYEHLDWRDRDAYGAEEEVAGGHRVRRRFATGVAPCFVISPIGAADSAQRQRADFVFDRYVKRACAGLGFRPFRSDQEFSLAVRKDLMTSIGEAKVVLSYLGSPPWNPNVMLEIGYRLATGGAIVLLRDSPKDVVQDQPLPFDITDMQVLHLPPRQEESDPSRSEATIADLVIAIGTAVKTVTVPWSSHHPFTQIEFKKNSTGHVIREATKEAGQLFNFGERLAGANIGEVIGGLAQFMPDQQFKAFADEQEKLIRALTGLTMGIGDCQSVTATIPMVFERHPNEQYNQKAFLPIIVKHQGTGNDDRLLLNVLYLDVTSATRIENGRFICSLERGDERFKLVWDNYAVSYDRILPRISFYKEVVARHVKAMSSDNIRTVLDIGAGSGNVAVRLMKLGKRVTAVDRSRAMLDLMRCKVLELQDPSCLILEQSAEHLPLRNQTFDGVNILLALFAMDNPEGALKEAMRIVKPGGTLVLTEPKRTFNLQMLFDQGRKELEENGELAKLLIDWNRVMAVNQRIDPKIGAKLPVENIAEILEGEGFVDLVCADSHLGNCQTITARKPQ